MRLEVECDVKEDITYSSEEAQLDFAKQGNGRRWELLQQGRSFCRRELGDDPRRPCIAVSLAACWHDRPLVAGRMTYRLCLEDRGVPRPVVRC